MHCRDGWVKGWVEWMATRTEEWIARSQLTGWQIWAHNSAEGGTSTQERQARGHCPGVPPLREWQEVGLWAPPRQLPEARGA